MYQLIKENLERKFHAIEKLKDDARNFNSAVFEYTKYISTNKLVGNIIEELALAGEINKELLDKIFIDSILVNNDIPNRYIKKKNDIFIPTFLSKELESKFHLLKDFRETIIIAKKEDDEFRRKGIKLPYTATLPDKTEVNSDFSELIILHNNIIESLLYREGKSDISSGKERKNNIPLSYQYNNGRGVIIINSKEIEFTKTPAKIIKYYWDNINIDESYKTYKDYGTSISSSEFAKTIKHVNQRIFKETEGYVKEILHLKEKKKTTEINKYKFKMTT